ncbi:unnamed protein product [Caenorhabditis auriculariae]|uniref:C-type lectin domain-containing protein n=1 Tax=Caenorhabditis auriculariae TaxID=2777116 RepID=A0A8S1H3F9_9PELO|nr:unnamed protein product [Caenorhabditis auriculariae]
MLALPAPSPTAPPSQAPAAIEEDDGIIKSGMVTAGLTPVKSRRILFCVVMDRALVLYDNEKSYRKKKEPKILMDLSVAFNCHKDHYDAKLKKCICVMGPDETLVLRTDSDEQNNEWYEAILSSLIPARAIRLGRPVSIYELFEAAWDVNIIENPKFKKPRQSMNVNIITKVPAISGPKRICFYAHTIIVCKRRIEPTNVNNSLEPVIPPFPRDSFVELPRTFIAFFGCQEKYFLLRMGRGSVMGGSELWAQCDNEDVALDMHYRLNAIIEREAEKKRKMNIGNPPPPSISTMRYHRERSHTQPIRQRVPTLPEGTKRPRMATMNPKRTKTRPKRSITDDQSNSNLSSARSTTASEKIAESVEEAGPSKDSEPKDERRGGRMGDYFIGAYGKDEKEEEKEAKKKAEEDPYVSMEAAGWNFEHEHLAVPAPPPPTTFKLDEARSYISDSTDSCYSSMAANSSTTPAIAENPPRANSFGGRTTTEPLKPQATVDTIETVQESEVKAESTCLAIPADDPRKRAFSLGSKTFFNFIGLNDIRKMVKKKTRNNSPGHSASTSLYQLPFFESDMGRNRCQCLSYTINRSCPICSNGSFGSGRSSPFGSGLNRVPRDVSQDNHVEMDFGQIGVGRSGSGSVASVDSPSRRDFEEEAIRPSEIALQQHRQSSEGEYVFTDVISLRSAADRAKTSVLAIEGGLKSMDLKNAIFETIQENSSLKSSRSSSRTSVGEDEDVRPTKKIHEEILGFQWQEHKPEKLPKNMRREGKAIIGIKEVPESDNEELPEEKEEDSDDSDQKTETPPSPEESSEDDGVDPFNGEEPSGLGYYLILCVSSNLNNSIMRYFFVFAVLIIFVESQKCPGTDVYDDSLKKCYSYFRVQGTFKTAQETCQKMGYGLVKLINAFQNYYVTDYATDNLDLTYGFFYTGLKNQSSRWVWEDGSPANFTNWVPGEPEDDRKCMIVRISDGRWLSANCDERFQFVCEGNVGGYNPGGTCPPCPSCGTPRSRFIR